MASIDKTETLPFYPFAAISLSSALARYAPLPFIDDYLYGRIKRYAVAKVLQLHHRTFTADQIYPLVQSNRALLGRAFNAVFKVPMKIILFPLRKISRLLRVASRVPRDFSYTFLLVHSLSRCLAKGWLPDEASDDELRLQAAIIRKSYDRTYYLFRGRAIQLARTMISWDRKNMETQVEKILTEINQNVDQQPDTTSTADQNLDLDPPPANTRTERQKAMLREWLQEFDAAFDRDLATEAK